MTDIEWEITFDGKNTQAIQALVGRMRNRDGDVDQVRFYQATDKTWRLWIEDVSVDTRIGTFMGDWVDVREGDAISKIGSMWVPKYGDSPVFRVKRGKNND